MTIDETTLADLKAKHGEVWVMEFDVGDVAIRAPSQGEVQCFQDGLLGDTKLNKRQSTEQLARSVVVHPSPDDFTAMLSKRFGILLRIGGAAAAIASSEESKDAKKA